MKIDRKLIDARKRLAEAEAACRDASYLTDELEALLSSVRVGPLVMRLMHVSAAKALERAANDFAKLEKDHPVESIVTYLNARVDQHRAVAVMLARREK